MPIRTTTLTDLKRTTAHLDFLLTAPSVKLKSIPSDNRLCAICQEAFNGNTWHLGARTSAVVNSPVQLACGHIFGLQCLAHLVFTADFTNRCPLCRAPIVPNAITKDPSAAAWKAAVPLLQLLMMFGGDAETFDKQMGVEILLHGLEREGLTGAVSREYIHRVMLLYDEFLTQFCDPSQLTTSTTGQEERRRLAAAEARVAELTGVIRESGDLSRRLVREAREGLDGVAREEAEREVRDLREELEAVRAQARTFREGREVAREALRKAQAVIEMAVAQSKLTETAFAVAREELEYVRASLDAEGWSPWLEFFLRMSPVAVLMVYLVRWIAAVRPGRRSWLWVGLLVSGAVLGLAAFVEWERLGL